MIRCKNCYHIALMQKESLYCKDCIRLGGTNYAPSEETMVREGTKPFSFTKGISIK
jgi:hypothetical protein